MTGSEILNYIETRIGRSIDSDLVLEAINEALDTIGELGLLYATTDLTVEDTNLWYSMPDDYTTIEKVIKFEDKEYIYTRWEHRTGEIRFYDQGEYRIVATKMPEHLSLISDNFMDLHKLYHNAVKYYALAWVKENDDFSDPAAEKLYARFQNNVKRAAQTLSRSKPPSKVQVKRHA
jgi:hypothetical protein